MPLYRTEELVEAAIKVALTGHMGQKDKAGEPYILHPLRVMMNFTDPVYRAVAVMHDVLEDTSFTVDQLCDQGFPNSVVYAVLDMSHAPHEDWEQYIARVKTNPVSRQVKLADLRDNMTIQRLWYMPHALDAKMAQKLREYLWAYKELQ